MGGGIVGLAISKEELAELPLETFKGEIVVVDHVGEIRQACHYLSSHGALGFDTETRPAFKRGQINKVALVQLSTEEVCFLFRLNKIGYPDELERILSDPGIKKIGLSLRDDFAALRKRSGRKPENFIDLQGFVDQFGIEDNSLQKIYAILFGKKISKNQRVSNWEAETLTPAQQSYAAIDAWACLRIYNHLIRTER
ncbi:3'-5' exonuclease [Proteiniphilum sp. X52]|uniref:3'-5' exonuclease n=1 Tax=Proteiniphilum sp. X52 TaxID=2382159 RepID=UPI000F0A1489|nr:3'-5' exonuclease [Proteiniphilum sp. X52]RNC66901.1 3'-5' exonuclease domain-containing protein 2 [Proteiniphilum sp. X52]